MCNTCKEVTTATKRLRIHRFPNTLMVHLKRFKTGKISVTKIRDFVAYPATGLQLHELATPESGCRKGGATYDLVGQCLHAGSMAAGHYTSICRVEEPGVGNNNLAWHLFNDDKVSSLASNQLVSPSAYVLLYSLRPYEELPLTRKERRRAKARARGLDRLSASSVRSGTSSRGVSSRGTSKHGSSAALRLLARLSGGNPSTPGSAIKGRR